MKRAILLSAFLASCGPKPTPAPIPLLPGDGDTNVVKPTTNPTTKPADNDPWAGRTDMIVPRSTLRSMPSLASWPLL